MTLIWALLVIVVLGVTAAIAVGRGGGLEANHPDRPDVLLPTGRALTPEDVEDVEFSVTLRGYRMDEVDEVLRRLRAELAERDDQIALLGTPRHRAPESAPGEESAPGDSPPPSRAATLHTYPTPPGPVPSDAGSYPTDPGTQPTSNAVPHGPTFQRDDSQ